MVLPVSTTLHNPGEQHMRTGKGKFRETVCSVNILGTEMLPDRLGMTVTHVYNIWAGLWNL